MKATLALYGWSLWYLVFATWGAYNTIGDIRGGSDASAALWVAITLVFAGRSTHYANRISEPKP